MRNKSVQGLAMDMLKADNENLRLMNKAQRESLLQLLLLTLASLRVETIADFRRVLQEADAVVDRDRDRQVGGG